tara:strand:- start:2197 stop:2730 length:534 start_codon:yes stop_codon:yes gene_type:complete
MPELAAFDGDPELQELAARVFGEPVLSYDFTDPATATNTLLSLILRERVRRLESAIETIEAQARCARAAQERWRALLHAGGDIVFVNMVGDTARIPSEIVDLIGRHAPVDVVVVEEAEHVAFKQGGRTVARVPKSLLVVLPDLLERGLWEAPKSSSRRSQSHQSRGNAAGGEGVSRG